ncbi:MAG: hypothetical protein D3916_15310, partial [Candidatus Electrothrix sp. MAN1_4]|nr:hypothetical protein [Candidatus Electrothrix sp. MAN1_4]
MREPCSVNLPKNWIKERRELNMPAKDAFHHLVKEALQKEGWSITT